MIEVVHIAVAMKPLGKRNFAQNALSSGVSGLNVDGCRVGTEPIKICNYKSTGAQGCITHTGVAGHSGCEYSERIETAGRWPANIVHDGSGEVVLIFPSTISHGGGTSSTGFWARDNRRQPIGTGDSGSAARFFKELDWLDD